MELKVERGRRVFPVSDKAEEIRQALLRYAQDAERVHDGEMCIRDSQNGEHHGEHRMHPAGKLIQTACPCHSPVPYTHLARVGEGMMIGVSVHSVEEAREAVKHGADCLGVGAA